MGILGMVSPHWVVAVQRSCRLLQTHAPMSLRAYVNSNFPEESQVLAASVLLSDAARFRKLHHIELELGSNQYANDPLAIALQFLSSPVVQSIRSVQFPALHAYARLRSAIWQLPALTEIRLSSRSTAYLESSALPRIRQCTWKLETRDFRALQSLSAMSSLDTLVIDMERNPYAHSSPQEQAIAVPSLTALTLRSLKATHAQARALFSQIPALQELTIHDTPVSASLETVLLGAGDIGLVGLPALRRCVIACTGNRGPTTAELRRFLHRCPQIESLVLDVSLQPEFALQMVHLFSAWGPPVRIEFGACNARPLPVAADDEVLQDPPDN